ncbi:hypothetical protein KZ122_000129 [Enterococcus faecalis]|nr:hypothetical protein [Enterococcus faecalis]EGO6065650.1 hypothetical protein [Enterococcus faecalis]EHS7936702.1 hypothetical protein [Enterococcus faecalis]EHV0159185.1 hypothetical protein [Enterococcus faecalis]EHZ9210707.1 hypothetical protein [Enterococcus faecalis]
MNEADILAMTYLDSCVIERMNDIENAETGITDQGYSPIHEGKLKCALSQSGLGSAGSLPVVENKGTFNITYEDQKLFLMPDVDVKKADRITVIQSTGQKHILFAKKPFYYPSHIEVTLTGSAIDE